MELLSSYMDADLAITRGVHVTHLSNRIYSLALCFSHRNIIIVIVGKRNERI